MKNKWYKFDSQKGSYQKKPPIKKYVLVECRSLKPEYPNIICVGYRKNAAGDKQSPQFITPGAYDHGKAVRWCDCLPDNFEWPIKGD